MFKERYIKAKKKFLTDKTICKENRELFARFFELEEKKLKRMNDLTSLDEGTYKTLNGYISRYKNINKWFKNKPLNPQHITQEIFTKVFNDLADGKIKNNRGEPYADVGGYVFKVFKSKLFKLAGLTQIVEDCEDLTFYQPKNEVEANFIEDSDMNNIIEHTGKTKMKTLFQLCYDIGENVSAITMLKKRDCRKEFNKGTKQYEYLIHLKKEILKRTRTTRSEPTRLIKTVELLDFMLKDLDDDDYIFIREDNMVRIHLTKDKEIVNVTKRVPLGLRSVEIYFDRLVKRLGIKTVPKGELPKLKTIRVSMACDCLKKGWTTDEINSRLGHSITSKALKPYVTFFALGNKRGKLREYKENVEGLNEKLDEQKDINKLQTMRLEELKAKVDNIEQYKEEFEEMKKFVQEKYIKVMENELELTKKIQTQKEVITV